MITHDFQLLYSHPYCCGKKETEKKGSYLENKSKGSKMTVKK